MIVDVEHRGLGIGGQLMGALESWAHQHGYPRAWVATGDAVGFYQTCGWELTEVLQRSSGEVMSVLSKSL